MAKTTARTTHDPTETAHSRHKATPQQRRNHEQPAKTLQGAYGSGGSYGVGGGFAEDEPGSKTEAARDTVPDIEPTHEVAPDVHTRAPEIDDDTLREMQRADQERRAAATKRGRGARR